MQNNMRAILLVGEMLPPWLKLTATNVISFALKDQNFLNRCIQYTILFLRWWYPRIAAAAEFLSYILFVNQYFELTYSLF